MVSLGFVAQGLQLGFEAIVDPVFGDIDIGRGDIQRLGNPRCRPFSEHGQVKDLEMFR
jgi:hypothetical protein